MHALAKPLLLVLVAGLLSACDSVPKEEFKAYSEAFAQVGEASERMLVEYALAKQEEADRKKTEEEKEIEAAPYPSPVGLQRFLVDAAPDNDITQRRRAIEVVTRYNDLMLVLAEGKSPAEVRSSAESLISAINGVGALLNVALPGIPSAATAIAAEFIAAIQAADNRAQFDKALRLGEPLIQHILALLEQDAISLYEVRYGYAEIEIGDRLTGIREMVAQIEGTLSEFQAPPPGNRDFQAFEDSLRAALAPAGLDLIPETWDSGPAGPAFSNLALSQVQQTQKLIADEAAKITALESEMRAYSDVTITYIRLLQQTRSTLAQVRSALDQPADIRAQALELIRFTFEVKRNFEALDAKRSTGG